MAIFEIKDNGDNEKKLLGYLFYYERSRRFFTELLSSLDEWDAPFIFEGFVKRGQYSIDSEWSMKFVRQRIIPSDRQNLGQILKDNKLPFYDEYKLVQLSEGRCAQDDLNLVRCSYANLADEIKKRFDKKVHDLIPMDNNRIMVFFNDQAARVINIGEMYKEDRRYTNVLKNQKIFRNARVSPGGHGVEWGEERFIPAETLYHAGRESAIRYDDLLAFVTNRLVDTTETAGLLNCSRQYINQLSAEEKLVPVKRGSNNNLFLKCDIDKDTL